jgi:hypothetical protein
MSYTTVEALIRFRSYDRGGATHSGTVTARPGMILRHNFDPGRFRIVSIDYAANTMMIVEHGDAPDAPVRYLQPKPREVTVSEAWTVTL